LPADYHDGVIASLGRMAVSVLVAVATGVLIVAVSIAPFLSPQWVAFEQDRSGSAALTGYTPSELRTATDSILHDLVLGPPNFDVAIAGHPVLSERERAHERDVRAVFARFYLAAGLALVMLVLAAIWRRRPLLWSAIRGGALVVAGGVLLLGVVATLSFDRAFAVFHEIFFAPGTGEFDPLTSRLVQIFPDQFWSDTSIVAAALIFVLSAVVATVGGRRAAAARRREVATRSSAQRSVSAEPAR
jgi:integral membrane protein (TIGR01906 family)